MKDQLLEGEIAWGGEKVVVKGGLKSREVVAEDADEFGRVAGRVPSGECFGIGR